MLKEILRGLANKRAGAAPSSRSGPAEEGSPAEPARKRSAKTTVALFGVAGLALAALGFAVTVTFLSSTKEMRQPPLNMKLAANLPRRPSADSQPPSPNLPQQAGEAAAQSPQAGSPGDTSGYAPNSQAPSMTKTVPAPVHVTRRDVDTKVVGEFDPFKSEFEKKYEQAQKKGKSSRRRSGGDGDLSELEKGLKAGPVKQIMPVQQMPPPLPSLRELKLNVDGVVVSRGDSYALTDRGIIRVGSSVDSFQVEKIEFDRVTLRSKDNNNDVRHLFLTAKNGQPGSNNQPVAPMAPR